LKPPRLFTPKAHSLLTIKGVYEQATQTIKTNWEESLKRVLSETESCRSMFDPTPLYPEPHVQMEIASYLHVAYVPGLGRKVAQHCAPITDKWLCNMLSSTNLGVPGTSNAYMLLTLEPTLSDPQ